MSKSIKESVAFYVLNEKGEFLAVQRAEDDPSLPGVWGIAGGSLRDGESVEDAVKRSARDKLNIEIEILQYESEDTIERITHWTHLREYQVKIVAGEPKAIHKDKTASCYQALKWSSNPEILREAAVKGSLCSRIFLRNRGLYE